MVDKGVRREQKRKAEETYRSKNVELCNAKSREWRRNQSPERLRELNRKYYNNQLKRHRDHVLELHRKHNYKRKYGMLPEEIETLLHLQGDICPICEKTMTF